MHVSCAVTTFLSPLAFFLCTMENIKLDECVVIAYYIASLFLVEETPEFGQFFRDVSSMLKEKTGETGEDFNTTDPE